MADFLVFLTGALKNPSKDHFAHFYINLGVIYTEHFLNRIYEIYIKNYVE